ncbi:hypothetical protein MHIB_14670 [Mycolicibacter hiberniae]|uniref:Uncharacterized protein n=1 Tax=Mycolicibacter hiberniae TaxID=29314 RepID=A0A7I7WZP4_9MYCO|nr:hypothetical protein MHIB_14670 [Mycolicibacter hiberniae]
MARLNQLSKGVDPRPTAAPRASVASTPANGHQRSAVARRRSISGDLSLQTNLWELWGPGSGGSDQADFSNRGSSA